MLDEHDTDTEYTACATVLKSSVHITKTEAPVRFDNKGVEDTTRENSCRSVRNRNNWTALMRRRQVTNKSQQTIL